MAAPQRTAEVVFPSRGLVRNLSFQQQAPFSTNDAQNVRLRGVFDGRARGGSRPGTGKEYDTLLGSGAEVRMLEQVTVAESGTGKQVTIADVFNPSVMGSNWSAASWIAGGLPTVTGGTATASAGNPTSGAVYSTVSDLNTGADYAIGIFIRPYLGNHHGSYQIFARMNDSTPVGTTDGLVLTLTMQGATGAYSGTLVAYNAGTPTTYNLTGGSIGLVDGGWLTLSISGNTATVKWRSTTILTQDFSAGLGAGAGTRFGFGMVCLGPGDTIVEGRCAVERFDATYESSSSVNQYRAYLIAVAGGKLYKDGALRAMVQEGTAVSDFPTDRLFTGAEWTQKLYIASPGKGSGLWIYDPVADTLNDWAAAVTAGTAPTGCHIVALYRDALVLAGDPTAPQVWYKSRNGDPLDFNYGASAGDATRAVSGANSPAGRIGEPITALCPYSDDYLVMGATGSLWVMRGDPASSGIIDVLSNSIGILGPRAWAYGPEGQLIFLSNNGVYMLPPNASGAPIPLSEGPLPEELKNLPVNGVDAVVLYDAVERGVVIQVSQPGINAPRSFWIDWDTKTFWPEKLSQRPTAGISYKNPNSGKSTLILGGEDGYLRSFGDGYWSDDGTAFTSYADVGPLRMAAGGNFEGILIEMAGTMSRESNDVTVRVRVGESAEEALTTDDDFYVATWGAGLSYSDRPRARGQALRLRFEATMPWTFERAHATVRGAGRQRRL